VKWFEELDPAKVAEGALWLLRAPYTESFSFATSNMCAQLRHPARWPQDRTPKYARTDLCICGKQVGRTDI
jgi:hypothetical protein